MPLKLNLNIPNKAVHAFIPFIVLLAVVGFVWAYNPGGTGGDPVAMGHSVDEMDWSQPLPSLHIKSITVPQLYIQNGGATDNAQIKFERRSPIAYSWNIGMFASDQSDFQFRNWGGTPILHLNYDGNVGIGTTTPAYKLDVVGALRLQPPSSVPIGVNGIIYYDSTANKFKCYENSAWIDCIGASAGSDGWTDDGAVVRLTTSADRVGIGTTGPDAKLDVLATAGPQQRLTYTDGSIYSDFTVDSGGNLAIRPTGRNIFIGLDSGKDPLNTGTLNTFLGSGTGASNTTGLSNVAVGSSALQSNTTGGGNTAVGVNALYKNTAGGCSNTAIGYSSLYSNTTGCFNTGIGQETLQNNQTGFYNTAVGQLAGAGAANNSFARNSLFGFQAGFALTTGSNNILVGYNAGNNLTTGANNIVLGYDIDAPSAVGSNQLSIGNLIFGTGVNGTGAAISTGNIGIGTKTPTAKLEVAGQVKITGGTPGANKVLTSDAAGLASWQASVGGGDITDVNGGSGLLPDTCSSGACTLNVNTGATLTTGLEIVSDQVRLMDDGCVAGEVLKRNAANNGWECMPDVGVGLTCNTKQGTFSAYGELYCDAGYTAVFGYCGGAAAIWASNCSLAGMCGLIPTTDAAIGMCWRMPPGSTITLYLRCCK